MGCGSSSKKEPEVVVEEPKVVDFKYIHSKVRWNRDFDEIKEALFSLEAVNCVDPGNGNSPLHIAAQNGHFDVTKLLIERGAIVNAQNAKGNTALHMAISYDYDKCVKAIIDAGADVELVNAAGFPAKRGLDGDKSLALLHLSAAKTTDEINAAFKECIDLMSEFDKATFVNYGLKAKKTVGPSVWDETIQEEFKRIMDIIP